MASNGFVPVARSRPRARQQRVAKTSCYAHPRFLQLVKELARLDDAKKKQDELEHSDEGPSVGGAQNSVIGSIRRTACVINEEPATTSSNSQHSVSHRGRPQHHHHPHHYLQHQQRASVVDSWQANTTNCCSLPNEAHQSNGCRSLDSNRSTLALNDSYYLQNSSNDNSPIATHGIHHQQNYQHRPYNYPSNHYQNPIDNASSNISQSHGLEQEFRCLNKSVPSSSTTPATHLNYGYSKIVPGTVITDVSAVELEQRQDENRSKRKRTINDLSAPGKRVSLSLSPSSSSKRHKSSPEPVRPLSPSFTKCPICLLDCMDRDPSFTNTCFHLFCFVCIENWSKSKATCPLCRTKFNKIVYNIKSASCFDEKNASPIRREDEDDRLIYEQLHTLNANALGATRSSGPSEQARQFFDNLRQNHSVLPPQFALIDQTFNRHVSSLQNFNSVSNSNFNPSVPHIPFTTASYNPVGSPYILLAQDQRPQTANSGPAMYIVNSDSSNRRIPRSGRSPYHRPHDQTIIDASARISRSTSVDQNQSGISLGGIRHHHHLLPGTEHPSHDQHNHHTQQPHHRSATIEVSTRQGQRVTVPSYLPYLMPPRHSSTNVFSRRHYANPPGEQHILNLYGSLPDS